jgi:hypothetical protein
MAAGLPRGWLGDTAALYRRAFQRGAVLAVRNWPVGLVVVLYGALLGVVRLVAIPLGLAGGFLVYLATVACASSWLSLVAEVIRSGRIRLQDVPAGFAAYLGDLLTAGFLIWGLFFIGSLLLAGSLFLQIVLGLAVLVFLNALPELIYLGRYAGAELLVESYRFIGENWIEWFPANVVLIACVTLARNYLPTGPYGLVVEGATGIALYFAMIVRGLLFLELASSSRRGREFRRRAAS